VKYTAARAGRTWTFASPKTDLAVNCSPGERSFKGEVQIVPRALAIKVNGNTPQCRFVDGDSR